MAIPSKISTSDLGRTRKTTVSSSLSKANLWKRRSIPIPRLLRQKAPPTPALKPPWFNTRKPQSSHLPIRWHQAAVVTVVNIDVVVVVFAARSLWCPRDLSTLPAAERKSSELRKSNESQTCVVDERLQHTEDVVIKPKKKQTAKQIEVNPHAAKGYRFLLDPLFGNGRLLKPHRVSALQLWP